MLSSTVPTCLSYDPAYVYEMAVILQDGIRRMYQEGEDRFYYITMYNEDYAMPPCPKGARGRHPARHLQIQSCGQRYGYGATLRQRADPE